MARAEAVEKGADEALLLNTNGEVAETASGNLFWVHDDAICTVPTGCGVLPGVTRAVVLEICQTLGLKTNIVRHQAGGAAKFQCGIFVTQSALGIVPVATFRRHAGHAITTGGSNCARLPRNAVSTLS